MYVCVVCVYDMIWYSMYGKRVKKNDCQRKCVYGKEWITGLDQVLVVGEKLLNIFFLLGAFIKILWRLNVDIVVSVLHKLCVPSQGFSYGGF